MRSGHVILDTLLKRYFDSFCPQSGKEEVSNLGEGSENNLNRQNLSVLWWKMKA